MLKRLMINDIKANKIASAATGIFMAVSAMLLSLTVLLSGDLLGSIDHLMELAHTPDFVQMHMGEIDQESLDRFAKEQTAVEAYQLSTFLNLENAILSLGEASLSGNSQDNGLCVQNGEFDLLLDTDNEVIQPERGEVYVPSCYRNEYDVKIGDSMQIGAKTLTVAGFLRDSQMNSMMASSKRFLVHEEDYERFREIGEEEYLIEFLIKDGEDPNAFTLAYTEAGLPANGPTITFPLIRMMNALSDGMMILVIFLVGIVVLLISMLCIRFLLLTSLERDKKEIGMLKAVGISKKDIRSLYFSKFMLLSAIGAVVGFLLAIWLSVPLGESMRRLYGAGSSNPLMILVAVLSVILVEGIMLLSIKRTLKRTEKISAVQALRGDEAVKTQGNRAYLFISIVVAAGVFLMLIPQNIAYTLSSPEFVTYMGVGNGQIRVDVRQSEAIDTDTIKIAEIISQDERVGNFSVLQTKSMKASLASGERCALLVEFGDHSVFPLSFSQGGYPKKSGEIALSALNAEDLGVSIGDDITLTEDGVDIAYTVCGIYSDVTNGGKTAKAYEDGQWKKVPAMWSILYIELEEKAGIKEWIDEYRILGEKDGLGIRVTDIQDFVTAMYGQTIEQMKMASRVAMVVSAVILFTVSFLFLRLIVERERKNTALKKALGFADRDLRMEYMKKSNLFIVGGIVAGILLGILLGEQIAGLLLGALGASDFQFVWDNGWMVFRTVVISWLVGLFAVRCGLTEISRMKIKEML